AAHPQAPDSLRVEALRWAAHARTVLQEPDLALLHLDEAMTLDAADPWLHYARGTACNTMGAYQAALASYTRALELDPDHLRARQWRGETRRMLGDRDGARDDFEATLALLERTSPETVAAWGADWEALHDWVVDALAGLQEL
ncbi:MAG: hypothetical protein O2816_19450, partial [Planctomycetota bacterium]|nr:hypothetical protein [Planctomycetota bacterium]